MRVKICGITTVEDAQAAARWGADFIGLILAPSARRVTLETARQVLQAISDAAQPVLLFRDAPLADVLAALAATGCGWVQLHGHEPVSYLRELASQRPDVRLIKAWEVATPQAGPELSAYLHEAADAGVSPDVVILDAPKGGPHPGYGCLAQVSQSCTARPPEIWCAGALTPTNVVGAVRDGRYDGVDVASGVETRPGIKDPDAVRRFIEAARRL